MKMILPIIFFILGIFSFIFSIISLITAFAATNYHALLVPSVFISVISSCANIVVFGCTMFLRSKLCKTAFVLSIIGIIFSTISFIILFSI